MNKKQWDGSDLSYLAYDYLNSVLGRMSEHGADQAFVRFGLLGNGTHPHYQIMLDQSKTVTFNGANHEFDQRTPEFANKNLSREYSFHEIQQSLRGKPKSKEQSEQVTYAHFKENRATIPQHLASRKDEIVVLVMAGVDVKDAFDIVAKQHQGSEGMQRQAGIAKEN